MSASSTPTRLPFLAIATASIEVTVDLPTPPLPDTTAITFLTVALGFKAASRLSALRSAQSLPQLEQLPLQELIMNSLLIFDLAYYSAIFEMCQPIIRLAPLPTAP
jgi:hypothetical protein